MTSEAALTSISQRPGKNWSLYRRPHSVAVGPESARRGRSRCLTRPNSSTASSATYPRGYLFADEVGLGKTIEAGMVLRELFLSGRAQKALLLVPASVMKQWQEELHEKMNLDVPRLRQGRVPRPA